MIKDGALGIAGSPRKEGNTSLLVQQVLGHLEGKTRFISLAGLNINPCRCCGGCWDEETRCLVDDDMRPILKEMERSDAIILGSPCYFGTVSAQLKMLIDRSVSLHFKRVLQNKVAAAVCCQDAPGIGSGGELVLLTLEHFFSAQMIYAGQERSPTARDQNHRARQDRQGRLDLPRGRGLRLHAGPLLRPHPPPRERRRVDLCPLRSCR